MPEAFLALPNAERQSALSVVATRAGRPPYLLEKDVWVVWTLHTLFSADFGHQLVFKGGTSLSKVYGAIRRFSEDIDVTYDIRALIPELVGDLEQPIPPSTSQARKWTSAIREKLPAWVAATVLPIVGGALAKDKLPAKARVEGDCLWITYEAVAEGYAYVRPEVKVEFGARSTGEPCKDAHVVCDAASYLTAVSFPEADCRVMSLERTFWEKATAIHVFSRQAGAPGDRFSRHWYDLAQLHTAGHSARAIKDRAVAMAVATHKRWFWSAKDSQGVVIDYEAAIAGSLLLIPDGDGLERLKRDYAQMTEHGVVIDAALSFDEIIAACRAIQELANTKSA